MSEIHEQIVELEANIKTAEELIEVRQRAYRLSENADFRKLFHEEYFVIEAARLVQLSTDPALTLEQRADALSMAQATGHAKRFLSMQIQMGAHAERDLPQMKETLAELRALADQE